MADRNLALDVVESPAQSGGAADRVARVFLEVACCYRKDGTPTLTADCRSQDELEHEIARLKSECDAILGEARDRLPAGRRAGRRTADQGESTAERVSQSARHAPRKTPLEIDTRLLVSDRMTREVRTLRRNDKLSLADELMRFGNFRHVVVIDDDGDQVVGVISQRDIFYGALAWSTGLGGAGHQKVLESQPVKAVMHDDVVVVPPDMPLPEAARLMLDERIGCLPVVDDGRLVGILTEGDFLSLLTDGTTTRS